MSAANANWATETAANWAVTETGGVVGRISVRSIDLTEGLAMIAYWVTPASRGRGVALRALHVSTALQSWSFSALEK